MWVKHVISLLVSLVFAQTNCFTKKNEKTGVTDVCLVNISKHSHSLISICEVSERNLVTESQSIVDSVRCQQYCDLTQGCLYWTWYRRHCAVLPCLEDHLTKTNVCYLLSSCSLAGQKCSGCSSGSRVSERRERVRDLILDEALTFPDKQTIWSQQRESQASSSNYHQTCQR